MHMAIRHTPCINFFTVDCIYDIQHIYVSTAYADASTRLPDSLPYALDKEEGAVGMSSG